MHLKLVGGAKSTNTAHSGSLRCCKLQESMIEKLGANRMDIPHLEQESRDLWHENIVFTIQPIARQLFGNWCYAWPVHPAFLALRSPREAVKTRQNELIRVYQRLHCTPNLLHVRFVHLIHLRRAFIMHPSLVLAVSTWCGAVIA
jgi:hypothetical protein